MKKKKKLRIRKEFKAMKEQKEEIIKELEKERKKDQRQEGYEEKKSALGYEHDFLHRAHMKEDFVKKRHRGRVRGKLSHIRRDRHGRMAKKEDTAKG